MIDKFFSWIISFFAGFRLARELDLKDRIKRDERILKENQKIEEDLRAKIIKISDRRLSESDVGQMLSTYQED